MDFIQTNSQQYCPQCVRTRRSFVFAANTVPCPLLLIPWKKKQTHTQQPHTMMWLSSHWNDICTPWKLTGETTLVKWRVWWLKANIYRQIFSISVPPRSLCGPLSWCSGSQMCLWSLDVYSWWYITFLFFSLGSGRKQGSDKLAWILHWSAQFHGCCRYTFVLRHMV